MNNEEFEAARKKLAAFGEQGGVFGSMAEAERAKQVPMSQMPADPEQFRQRAPLQSHPPSRMPDREALGSILREISAREAESTRQRLASDLLMTLASEDLALADDGSWRDLPEMAEKCLEAAEKIYREETTNFSKMSEEEFQANIQARLDDQLDALALGETAIARAHEVVFCLACGIYGTWAGTLADRGCGNCGSDNIRLYREVWGQTIPPPPVAVEGAQAVAGEPEFPALGGELREHGKRVAAHHVIEGPEDLSDGPGFGPLGQPAEEAVERESRETDIYGPAGHVSFTLDEAALRRHDGSEGGGR